jgi:F-type H+-transporting ATPase subunit beta
MEETIRSFKAILNGDVDDIPEPFFFLQGNLDTVKEAYASAKR